MSMGIRFTLIGVIAAATLLAQGPGGRAGGFRGGPGGPGGPFGIGLGLGRTPVTGAPYSAVRTSDSVRSLAGGNQIEHQDQSKVYRSSQGQVRVEETFTPPAGAANQNPRTAITIFDPVAGNITRLDPQTKTAFQMQLKTPNGSQTGQAHPPHDNSNRANVQTTDLGSQIVNGVNATGVRTTLTIAAGAIGNTQPIQVVREVWTSTDLKVPVLVKTTDPRSGNSTSQLTNIVRAEPDATLFQVPSDYTIKTGGPGHGGPGPQGWRGRQ